MSLISDADKAALDSIMGQVHDTFKKAINAIVYGELAVISHDPNYSSIYSSKSIGGGSTVTPITKTFYGVIQHGLKQSLKASDIGDESALKIRVSDGETRVKVDQAGKEILEKAKKIEIDGLLYQVETGPRAHGLFSHSFYTFFLKRVD